MSWRMGSGFGQGSAASGVAGSLGSTDNALVRTHGTGGDQVQGSSVTVDDSGQITTPAGRVPVVLTRSVTSAQTTAVTTEETLWSYSLPAGTLASDGQAVRIRIWGTTAANANSKVIRAKFGANTFNSFTTTTSGESWQIEAIFARTGATTQTATGTRSRSTAGVVYVGGTGSETLANAITIALTGQNGTASAGDIVFNGAIVEFLP